MTYGEYKHEEYDNVKYFKALPTDPNETYYTTGENINLSNEGVNTIASYRITELEGTKGKYAKLKPGYSFWYDEYTKEQLPNMSYQIGKYWYYANYWSPNNPVYIGNPFNKYEHLVKNAVGDGNKISADGVVVIELMGDPSQWSGLAPRVSRGNVFHPAISNVDTRFFNKGIESIPLFFACLLDNFYFSNGDFTLNGYSPIVVRYNNNYITIPTKTGSGYKDEYHSWGRTPLLYHFQEGHWGDYTSNYYEVDGVRYINYHYLERIEDNEAQMSYISKVGDGTIKLNIPYLNLN